MITELASSSSPSAAPALIVPAPRREIAIRTATMDDLPFLDSLQKQYNKALGFFPRAQMEGYVRSGWVLVAEQGRDGETERRRDEVRGGASSTPSLRHSVSSSLPRPLG